MDNPDTPRFFPLTYPPVGPGRQKFYLLFPRRGVSRGRSVPVDPRSLTDFPTFLGFVFYRWNDLRVLSGVGDSFGVRVLFQY